MADNCELSNAKVKLINCNTSLRKFYTGNVLTISIEQGTLKMFSIEHRRS